MKNIFELMVLFIFVSRSVSCNGDEKVKIPALPVTAANLNGTWQLSEWNGRTLVEDIYYYITLNRRGLAFEMYRKLNSMYACYITGSFNMESGPYLGYVTSGEYGSGNGDWNNDYIVADLLESGSMIQTIEDDDSDVNKYVRCEKIPGSTIEEVKTSKN